MGFELEAGPTKKGAGNVFLEGAWAHQVPEGSARLRGHRQAGAVSDLEPSLPRGPSAFLGGSVSTQISAQCVVFLFK